MALYHAKMVYFLYPYEYFKCFLTVFSYLYLCCSIFCSNIIQNQKVLIFALIYVCLSYMDISNFIDVPTM